MTSGGNVIYAGFRESVYWGKTGLSTYLTFKTTEDFSESSTPEYSREYLFDSLTLYLTPDGKFRFFIDNAVQPELRSTKTSFNRICNPVVACLYSGRLQICRYEYENCRLRESAGMSTRTAAYENLPVRYGDSRNRFPAADSGQK